MRFRVCLLLLLGCCSAAADTLRIAVAANFKPTLQQLVADYSASTGTEVKLSSAASGVLASQVQHGAPFDLFFSADAYKPQALAGSPEELFCYARGTLVLAGGALKELARPDNSLAIANPVTAPYGEAAVEVLARPEFAAGSDRKLVRASNVAQAYQFWYSGAVDLALLPAALAPENATPIPEDWHQPIDQYALVVNNSAAVQRYLNWFRSDTVRSLINEAGYKTCH